MIAPFCCMPKRAEEMTADRKDTILRLINTEMVTSMKQPMIYTIAGDMPSTFLLDSMGSKCREKLRFSPHFELVDCPRYICFLPLITTYALIPGFPAPIAPHSHALDLFHEHILKAAAEKRCLLVFDTSPEGDPIVAPGLQHLASWLQTHGIPQSQVLIVNQNRELGAQYRAQIGENIRFSVYDSYVKKMLNIFAGDDDSFRKAVGFDREEVRVRPNRASVKTFLSLNGAPRAHRIVFVAALSVGGLLDETVWSMLGQKSGKLEPSVAAAFALRNALNLNWISDQNIESIFAQMPKFIHEEAEDIINIRGSDALALSINRHLFDLGFCSIATETEFSAGEVRRVSELSLKPFAMGHPTILCGNPGSLDLIRSFGFETFSPYIDESYDEIVDPAERFAALITSLKSFRDLRLRGGSDLTMIENICARNIEVARWHAVEMYERNVEVPFLADLTAMFGEV